MTQAFVEYNLKQSVENQPICDALLGIIEREMAGAESKIWHGAPVWFLDRNPIVGYHVLKNCVRVLFWSGQSFDEPGLKPEGTFKAAEARYTSIAQINEVDLVRWIGKAREIQWNYRDIMKKKGVLDRIS